MIVRFKKLDPRAVVPEYKSAGAAGADLCAIVTPYPSRRLYPGEQFTVSTGLVIEIPPGFEGQIRPRSGLAAKHGITVVNSPGTIDSDYRGEVKVALIHLGDEPVDINTGDRVAQLVIAPVLRIAFREAEELERTERGDRGFGSTGVG